MLPKWDYELADSSEGDDDHAEGGPPSKESGGSALVFLFGTFLLAAFTRTVFRRLPIPYTVVMLIYGILIGFIGTKVEALHEFTAGAFMDPNTIMKIALPVLIFNAAISIDIRAFVKAIWQIVLLSVPCTIMQCVMTAFFTMYAFDYHWNLHRALLFGSVLVGTDPMGRKVLLKQMGKSTKQIAVMVGGESLINEGIAMVLFHIFYESALNYTPFDAVAIITKFVQEECLAPLFGGFVGMLAMLWLTNVYDDQLTEITILLSSLYLTYYAAEEYLKISGVISIVTLGLVLNANKKGISPDVEKYMKTLFEFLAFLANSLVFLLVGDVVMDHGLSGVGPKDLGYLIMLYIFINLARLVVVVILSPFLNLTGYGMPWSHVFVVSWSALRGIVVLDLGLVVYESESRRTAAENSIFDIYKSEVIFHAAGIVLMGLVINATTVGLLLDKLGMNDIPPAKIMPMASSIRKLRELAHQCISSFKQDRFLGNSIWKIVRKRVHLEEPYGTSDFEVEKAKHVDITGRHSTCPSCLTQDPREPTEEEMKRMENIARKRLLNAQKMSFLKQYEAGLLGEDATRRLTKMANDSFAIEDRYLDIEFISRCWQVGIAGVIRVGLETLGNRMRDKIQIVNIAKPENKILELAHRLCSHKAFQQVMWLIALLNVLVVCVHIALEQALVCHDDIKLAFDVCNYVFIDIYIVEAVLQIMAYRKQYFFSHWHQTNLLLLLLAFVDVGLDETYCARAGAGTRAEIELDPQHVAARVLIYMRLLRIVKCLLGMVHCLTLLIYTRINSVVNFGYDVGKGYVMCQEEIGFSMNQIANNPKISAALSAKVNDGRTEITRQLGILQKEHPGIALSVITEEAARWCLNIMQQRTRNLRKAGLISADQADMLDLVFDQKIKLLVKMPARIEPSSLESVQENLPWIDRNQTIMDYLQGSTELLNIQMGETFIAEGDPPPGLYTIVSGLVKVDFPNGLANHIAFKKSCQCLLHGENIPTESPRVEDYLTTSSVVGEMSVLTGFKCAANMKCETDTQLNFIPYDSIRTIMKTAEVEPSIEYRLWKMAALRMAPAILKNHFSYKSWSLNNIKATLEKAELYVNQYPRDTTSPKGLVKFEMDPVVMRDVILIYGRVTTLNGRSYSGPCYIQLVTDTLTLVDKPTDTHVLLVVPRELALEFKTESEDYGSKVTGVPKPNTNLCLYHSATRSQALTESMVRIMADRSQRKSRLSSAFETYRRSSKQPSISRNHTLSTAFSKSRLAIGNTSGIIAAELLQDQQSTPPNSTEAFAPPSNYFNLLQVSNMSLRPPLEKISDHSLDDEDSAVEDSAVEPSTDEPSTDEPSAVEPSTVEPSTDAPSSASGLGTDDVDVDISDI